MLCMYRRYILSISLQLSVSNSKIMAKVIILTIEVNPFPVK